MKEFGTSASDGKETVSLRELLDFMEHPHSIGLDNLKESLRNIVQLMMELKGYATGYALQHLLYGEHSSMAMDGLLESDKKKKKLIQQFWDDMNYIENMLPLCLFEIKEYVHQTIINIKQTINEEIAVIDTHIKEHTSNDIEAQTMKNKSVKRQELKAFKNHIKRQEIELQEAETTKEVIELQKNVFEDVNDFDKGEFTPDKARPNPLSTLGDILDAGNDATYGNEHLSFKKVSGSDVVDDETGSSSGSGSSETSDDTTSSGGEQEDEQQKPVMDY